jgi:hypothetical protein
VVLRVPARFAALKQKSLWRQLVSAEAIYLTLFFTANVLILQLYLGACPFIHCQHVWISSFELSLHLVVSWLKSDPGHYGSACVPVIALQSSARPKV